MNTGKKKIKLPPNDVILDIFCDWFVFSDLLYEIYEDLESPPITLMDNPRVKIDKTVFVQNRDNPDDDNL